ncbi:hypothetical protein SCOR_06795 [Sulfidibacter corallicola]|uniref:Phytanoyl-CoA dioxygenase (PhyH) n=1 Tax=Sulfidibacter corallicola TaxID=2818388 RepID=A0A8A4TQR2_SULCO|nr:hypothetical protein [Sulfidibacter corallicola]QTD51524.1 hypothetical protein J3U87_03565 [Sulfidibacter corallicola]
MKTMPQSPDLGFFQDRLPADSATARAMLYDGHVFHLEATASTRRLAAEMWAIVEAQLGESGPAREAQFRLDQPGFYSRIGHLRKRFYGTEPYHRAVFDLLQACGFQREAHRCDPMRLRVITDGGFRDPKAAPVYYPHRDTWYANPQAQITWSLALHDMGPEDSFEFYPEYFDRPVRNDSECFDYDDWVQDDWDRKIGWQNAERDRSSTYPQLRQEIEPQRVEAVKAKAGDLIIFAGAHLHRTRPHSVGRTRFSVDFRTVHREDHERGRGAPNVDNRSRGSTFADHMGPDEIGNWGRGRL